MKIKGVVERKEDRGYVVNLRLKNESGEFFNLSDYKWRRCEINI